jgi:hypothetical protein
MMEQHRDAFRSIVKPFTLFGAYPVRITLTQDAEIQGALEITNVDPWVSWKDWVLRVTANLASIFGLLDCSPIALSKIAMDDFMLRSTNLWIYYRRLPLGRALHPTTNGQDHIATITILSLLAPTEDA